MKITIEDLGFQYSLDFNGAECCIDDLDEHNLETWSMQLQYALDRFRWYALRAAIVHQLKESKYDR